MEGIAFRPRILRGVQDRNGSTTLLGHELSFPVVLAPVGFFDALLPDGAAASARVAERVRTITCLSSVAGQDLEEVRARSDARLIWQLYVRGDRAWIDRQLTRAEAAGCTAICLTADVTAPARRERNPLEFYGGYRGPGTSPANKEFLHNQAAFTWEDVEWLRHRTRLRLIVKGITCREDAILAVERGIDVVYVSNHGGRQLDHQRGTLDVLPEIVAAVGDRAEVLVDGGFVRGSDVIKALALGARAVAVGKLAVWALAAAGEPGLEHVLSLLRDEITDLMALLGVRTVAELGPEHVTPAAAIPDRDWIGFARSEQQVAP
jgi:glycolate oxidase